MKPTTPKKFSLSQRARGVGYALEGLRAVCKGEHNMWIHIFAAIMVILLGLFLHLSFVEWGCIVFAIGLVIAMEIMNTAIEKLCDFVSPEKHTSIKLVKDMAAASVLVSALVALAIGLIIFLPKIF